MRLRELELKDAPLMLEWMHDKYVVDNMRCDFLKKEISDCEAFINASKNKESDINLAIVSENDEYMGTVSLKNIDRDNHNAEFAIVVRRGAMGKGYAWWGMKEIIKLAFENYGLDSIYWCVSVDNLRAVRFYNKHYFHEVSDIPIEIQKNYKNINNLKWYSVLKSDVLDEMNDVIGCRIVHIKTITTLKSGQLSVFESKRDVPFNINRIYYISKVPEGTRRGGHAHKKLKQLLFCPYGRIQILLENKNGKGLIELADPSIGLIIEEPTWREMLWLKKDSILCVAASDFYDDDDYIRNYEEFKTYIMNLK